MDIREKIGQRISTTRRAAKLTLKELANMTGELKPTRIGNWEHGRRSPGPHESQLLAKALGVSPAYLLCLTDVPHPNGVSNQSTIRDVPLFTFIELTSSKFNPIDTDTEKERLPLCHTLGKSISSNSYALTVPDDSMSPEFTRGDTIIVDPDHSPSPGNYVIARVNKGKAVLRLLRELKNGYELIPLNSNWAPIEARDTSAVIATVIEHRRPLIE